MVESVKVKMQPTVILQAIRHCHFPGPWLLVALSALIFLQPLSAESAPSESLALSACHIAIHFDPAFQIQQTEPFFLKLDAENYRLIAACSPNPYRTSRVQDIDSILESSSGSYSNLEVIHIDHNIEAAVYQRIRSDQGTILRSQDAYFATRDHEYRFYLIPSEELQANRNALQDSRQVLIDILRNMEWLQPPEATISESTYRWRLYLLWTFSFLISGLILFMAYRLVKKYRLHS